MDAGGDERGVVGGCVCVWCAVGEQGCSCRGSDCGWEHGHGLGVWVRVWFGGQVRFGDGGGVVGELCSGSELKVVVPAESAGTVDVRVMESCWV